MNSASESVFVVTKEYRRFVEFCDACRRYRYIGLCYGPPGVGKTLSARHYANWDEVSSFSRFEPESSTTAERLLGSDIVFYTPPVVNTPSQIEHGIEALRSKLRAIAQDALAREQDRRVAFFRKEQELAYQAWYNAGWRNPDAGRTLHRAESRLTRVYETYGAKLSAIPDPTALILCDEADRIKMAGLEQMRDVFDRGNFGIVLIGMPGIEKRLARFPQLYSRVGFVHEFRSLAADEVRRLLQEHWSPAGVALPADGLDDADGIAAILRVTGGNFRLLDRLLTQIARVLEINKLQRITAPVVEAARESLVIGTD